MRMPAAQFLRDAVYNIFKGEKRLFARHLRVKHHLKQHVAQLISDLRKIFGSYRISQLVCLFNGVGDNRVEVLLQIPGASRIGVP